jgi:pimeloyl-ACP methyl ester carboxylesterase
VSTYILIHGAWHGGWCWEKVRLLIEAREHRVITPDLAELTTLEACVERVDAILDDETGPAVLVGHSMGGAVISQAAEQRYGKVRALVYVCAYLLRDGETLAQAARRDAKSESPRGILFSADRSVMTYRHDVAREVFYADCTEEDAAWACARLTRQARSVWTAPVRLTEQRFGKAPRYYIECLRDKAITPAFQRRMYTAVPCRRVFPLDTGHSPFLSSPELLAELVLRAGESGGAGGAAATG